MSVEAQITSVAETAPMYIGVIPAKLVPVSVLVCL
jgi:hypothetical protein